MVYLTPDEAHASGELGRDGGKQAVQFSLAAFRHAQQSGQKHISGKPGMRPDGQHAPFFRTPSPVPVSAARACTVRMAVRLHGPPLSRYADACAMRMAGRFLMMFFLAAHKPFTTLAAAQAAPYPLSMFMMPTPGAQLQSALHSAALPPSATP